MAQRADTRSQKKPKTVHNHSQEVGLSLIKELIACRQSVFLSYYRSVVVSCFPFPAVYKHEYPKQLTYAYSTVVLLHVMFKIICLIELLEFRAKGTVPLKLYLWSLIWTRTWFWWDCGLQIDAIIGQNMQRIG